MYGQQSDFFSHYRALQEQAKSDILHESEAQILGTDTDVFAKYIYEKYALAPIVIDSAREESWDVQDYLQDIPANRRERSYRNEGTLRDLPSQRVVVEVPIVPNKDLRTMAGLQSSAFYSPSYSDRDFNWGAESISRSFETKGYQLDMDQDRIAVEVERALQSIKEAIRSKNASIEQGNRELLAHIKNQLGGRKQAIEKNKEKVAALTQTIKIPLKKKQNVSAQLVRVVHTPLVQRVKPKPALPEEYVVDEAGVKDTIALLDNQARSFERTPAVFKGLGEEALRDVLLSNLNAVFADEATGETFSKNGDTDIYLKITKGNILICECKIWGGKVLYNQTIDQLRGYLTWRHNYGVMITFVLIKDFTKTLRESEVTIQGHASYLNGFRKIGDTHFVSNHKVDDEDKKVEVHHLFYHLYSRS